jgi:phage baseplate assembly protein W
MADAENETRQAAEADYAAALARVAQPDRPASFAPADPYGRTLLLTGGDFVVAAGADGNPDLAMISGQDELAQGLKVLVGTTQGTDLFNVAFGFDLVRTLALPRTALQTRELVRMSVVKALSQEPRIRQIVAIAFVDEKAYLTIHPEVTPAEQQALAQQQQLSRRWSLDVQLDTRQNDRVIAGIEGVGP